MAPVMASVWVRRSQAYSPMAQCLIQKEREEGLCWQNAIDLILGLILVTPEDSTNVGLESPCSLQKVNMKRGNRYANFNYSFFKALYGTQRPEIACVGLRNFKTVNDKLKLN